MCVEDNIGLILKSLHDGLLWYWVWYSKVCTSWFRK